MRGKETDVQAAYGTRLDVPRHPAVPRRDYCVLGLQVADMVKDVFRQSIPGSLHTKLICATMVC